MRIQHNIMAMNAYRNYNTNTSALAGNLEKLSSGYKINRAGDDAAGLAISEKMRAQITGLDAAQKNVKDGISLVKTAEGAMQEIQDMLNRMDYLATQSANGTYQDEVDRENLQKEVVALKEEINRIADSANFNGIKLLDGSQAATKAQAAYEETIKGQTINGTDRMLKEVLTSEQPYQVNGKKTVLDSFAAAATTAEFQIDMTQLSYEFTRVGTFGKTTNGGFQAASATKGGALLGMGTLKLTIGGSADWAKTIEVKKSHLSANAKVAATANGGMTLTSLSATDMAAAVVRAAANNTTGTATSAVVQLNGVDWKLTANGGKLTFTQVNKPATASQARADFAVTFSHSTTSVTNGVQMSVKGALQDGTIPTKAGAAPGATRGAETVFEMKASDIVDGAVLKLGSKTFKFKVGKDSIQTKGTATALINLSNYEMGASDILSAALNAIGKTATSANFKVKNAAGTEKSISFKISVRDGSDGGPAGIAVIRAAKPTSGNMATTSDPLFNTKEKLGANFTLTYSDTKVKHEAVEANGGLTLQIGDTADSFNQMSVGIGDMHTKAMGTKGGKSIADINIGSQDGAADAIQVVKDAINYVSSVRGDLGALQNRLEHTGNNLSVMAENIQDAESTIRDTDVASEMMSYVKNNILVQSAQAMLAQANQVPQGVLQLLG